MIEIIEIYNKATAAFLKSSMDLISFLNNPTERVIDDALFLAHYEIDIPTFAHFALDELNDAKKLHQIHNFTKWYGTQLYTKLAAGDYFILTLDELFNEISPVKNKFSTVYVTKIYQEYYDVFLTIYHTNIIPLVNRHLELKYNISQEVNKVYEPSPAHLTPLESPLKGKTLQTFFQNQVLPEQERSIPLISVMKLSNKFKPG